ncbi:MAG TPA: ATP-binding protein [Anaerolineae bacterium]|nr:ATP-binding protein [Anaerolineae bacterium]
MDYNKFVDLIQRGESDTIEFKIECNALKGSDEANAELVKDIVALANNGYVASYILVGVSDDAQEFRSVTNRSLTSDNLQRLCRDSISPVPAVKLSRRVEGKTAAPEHQDKTFGRCPVDYVPPRNAIQVPDGAKAVPPLWGKASYLLSGSSPSSSFG